MYIEYFWLSTKKLDRLKPKLKDNKCIHKIEAIVQIININKS